MEKFLKLLKITMEIVLVILFIFFEELIWKKLAIPLKDYISNLEIAKTTKAKIETQSINMTLLIFLLPLGVAELMGIYSGMLIVSGSIIFGVFIYLLKVPVAAITFWIFSFTKEKLLKIDWFKTIYDLLMRFLNFIKNTGVYKRVKTKIASIKKHVKRLNPKSGEFSEEINYIYTSLTNLFNGLSGKVKAMKTEAKNINDEDAIKEREEKQVKEAKVEKQKVVEHEKQIKVIKEDAPKKN